MSEKHKTDLEWAAELATLQAKYDGCLEANAALTKQLTDLPSLRSYVLEVTKFHRETLLPLTQFVANFVKSEDKRTDSTEPQKAAIVQMKKFLTVLLDRTKFYEGSAYVKEMRARDAAEKAKMVVKEEVPSTTPTES